MGAIYGSSYYAIVDGPSWTQAEGQANALGGNLASIGSADENQYISRSFKDANKGYYGGPADKDIYWIGLNKKSQLIEFGISTNTKIYQPFFCCAYTSVFKNTKYVCSGKKVTPIFKIPQKI